jgi:hypothetical protein
MRTTGVWRGDAGWSNVAGLDTPGFLARQLHRSGEEMGQTPIRDERPQMTHHSPPYLYGWREQGRAGRARPEDPHGREPLPRGRSPGGGGSVGLLQLDPKIRTAANLFLAAAALAVAVALAYFATDWDSRIGGAGSVLLYYAAPAALLLLLARSLRAPPAQRVSMALLLFGTLAPLYAAEAALQVMRSAGPSFGVRDARNSICPGRWRNRPVCAAAAAAGVPFDSRSALHVLRDLEGDGVEAWPSQAPFGDAMGARSPDAHLVREGRHLVVDGRPILPLRPGVAMVRTVFCNEGGDWITYEADEHGFNNPPGLHRVGAARIALAGDSFGQGACVPAGANAAARSHRPGAGASSSAADEVSGSVLHPGPSGVGGRSG